MLRHGKDLGTSVIVMISWWRNRQARKRLAKQAKEVALPVIDEIKEGQKAGIFIPAQGTIMLHKYKYKIQRIRSDGSVVLKRLKEVL